MDLNIYDFIGVDNDPIYASIMNLKKGQQVIHKGTTITLNNFGLYEVFTVDTHDAYTNMDRCYQAVTETGERIAGK